LAVDALFTPIDTDEKHSANRPRVLGLLGSKIFGEPCVDAFYAVPSQGIEIVAHGMERPLSRAQVDGLMDGVLAARRMVLGKPARHSDRRKGCQPAPPGQMAH